MGQQNLSQRRDDFALANWNALSSVTGPEEGAVRVGGKGMTRVVVSEPVSDAESERHILHRNEVEDVERGIRQTRTVTVVSDPQSRSASRSRR